MYQSTADQCLTLKNIENSLAKMFTKYRKSSAGVTE